MLLHYKIVGVNEQCPDRPIVYRGSFERTDEEPTLTALVQEFGEPGKPAKECLREWSGGEVDYWAQDLSEVEPSALTWQFCSGEIMFYVFLGAGPLEGARATGDEG